MYFYTQKLPEVAFMKNSLFIISVALLTLNCAPPKTESPSSGSVFLDTTGTTSRSDNNEIEFESNTAGSKFETLLNQNDDEIKFEFRFWTAESFCPLTFVQITLDSKHNWRYRTGILNTTGLQIINSGKKTQNWARLWDTLNQQNIFHIPDQDDIDISTDIKGNKIEIKDKEYFFHEHLDGTEYIIEMIGYGNYRRINYGQPEYYKKELEKLGLSQVEHENFLRVKDILVGAFDLDKLQATACRRK
jgi:hypothetical protein